SRVDQAEDARLPHVLDEEAGLRLGGRRKRLGLVLLQRRDTRATAQRDRVGRLDLQDLGKRRLCLIQPPELEEGSVQPVADIAVVPQGQFPAAQWAILSTPSGEKVVRWGDLAQEIGHFRLRNRLETTPDAQLPSDALRLARDLLDKQIVDTHGAKVVRVNDLQLSEVDGQLRLVGADVGLRGLLRRVGAETVAERVAGLAGRRLPRGIIPWHLVEPL